MAYGDCFTEAPSWIHLQSRLIWNAWNSDRTRGMSRHEARESFIKILTKMFKDNGHEKYLPDPQKPFYEKAYKECVDRMLA